MKTDSAVQTAPEGDHLSRLVREIVTAGPWGHHANALAKLTDPVSRLWYLQAASRRGWSRNVLVAFELKGKIPIRTAVLSEVHPTKAYLVV